VRNRNLVIVDYDKLMENPTAQLERLATRLDLPLTDQIQQEIHSFVNSFLKRGLQHTRFSIDELKSTKKINVLVRDAYYWLDRLAGDEIQPTTPELWDAWDKINSGVSALGPLLARLDTLNRELRHAQWNPLSPIPAAWNLARRLIRR